jgi:hypothetical protein
MSSMRSNDFSTEKQGTSIAIMRGPRFCLGLNNKQWTYVPVTAAFILDGIPLEDIQYLGDSQPRRKQDCLGHPIYAVVPRRSKYLG